MPGQVCNSVRFNSRLPCGSRQTQLFCRTRCSRFNSRLPCGSRRYFRCPIWIGGLFQLTAPLREPTPYTICPLIRRCFNSRLPCGSRRLFLRIPVILTPFQLTAPLREPTMGS